jgi:hypothetical protein
LTDEFDRHDDILCFGFNDADLWGGVAVLDSQFPAGKP